MEYLWKVWMCADGLGVYLCVSVDFGGVGRGMSRAIWKTKPKQGGQGEPISFPGGHNSD